MKDNKVYDWHDIRNNPCDLPNEFDHVLVCVENQNKRTYNRTWLEGKLWRNATSKSSTYYRNGSVIAWKYIEPFEA